MIEIMFRGRGGQGAVVASEILGRAFFLEGKYPQSFALFGGERRGAPVVGFLRVDDEPILLKCQIKHPNYLILLDISLIEQEEIGKEVVPGGKLLINTHNSIEYFKDLRGFTIGLVDAASIARNLGLGGNFNMAMLGAYVRLTNLIKLETLIEAVTKMVPSKREENIQAVKDAYEQVKVYEAEG
jgi:2-oxoacid:acceptor oxidoreductase gamma subunit (pyruvate/2-ketoisovalerate family)